MRKFNLLFLVVFIVNILFISTVSAETAQEEVVFESAVLENAVRQTLNIPSGPIYDRDLLALERLEIWEIDGPNSLHGLEYAKNLKHLAIHNHSITELSPLSSLSDLEVLKLSNGTIQNIDVLLTMESLKYVDIYENPLVFEDGTKENDVLQELFLKEVIVIFDNMLSFEIVDATESSMTLEWEFHFPVEYLTDRSILRENSNVQNVNIKETNSYKVENLDPDTWYIFAIDMILDNPWQNSTVVILVGGPTLPLQEDVTDNREEETIEDEENLDEEIVEENLEEEIESPVHVTKPTIEEKKGDHIVTEGKNVEEEVKPETTKVNKELKSEEVGKPLPKTATSMYNFLIVGASMFVIGTVAFAFSKRRKKLM